MFDKEKPYNDLPHLPPQVDLGDKDILLASFYASQKISELRAFLESSSPVMHNLLDMLSPLFVPEAVSSSKIEEIVTTNDRVYYAKVKEQADRNPAEKETLNYTDALLAGTRKLFYPGFLSTNDYVALQAVLQPDNSGIRKWGGTVLKNEITGEIYYTPPQGENLIRNLLQNFENYFNEDTPSHEVFARMAVLHYQFEAIHPFGDGNGRTGRMLMPLYLMRQKQLPFPLLFISSFILKNRAEYYQRIRAVTTNGDWKGWILFILKATEEQATYTCKILRKINRSQEDVAEQLEKNKTFTHLTTAEIVKFLFTHAYFAQKDYQEEMKISALTATKHLEKLLKENLVTRRKLTGKNKYIYINPSYIRILKDA